ncbi:BTAD domain-containing putative transcriptional regulator, partial [Streptomyces sp. NPDC059851]|uniref:AfsR/SARP family transcriptional regulator n=1 Tax=Streptomyces sp. NPDC059851 TaxID=3346971 RepID=UPI00365D2397
MRRNLPRAGTRPAWGSGDNGPVRYAILGTTQVTRDDGTPVAVGGARLRALLTALALRPGRAVPAHLLVAEVWNAEQPADASAALQALVARLRRALGHGAVRSADGGYQLVAGREDVDLYRFERLVRSAAAAADTDPARAAALYDGALALWRGPALADLPDPGAEAARWEAVRRDARRGRLATALDMGEAARALPELAALCAQHPLDEPLQVLRIRALRDSGRAAEALAAYEEVRQDLADRLGTDPGPALRTLHAALLLPSAGPSGAPAAAPPAASSVPPAAASSPSASGAPSGAVAPPGTAAAPAPATGAGAAPAHPGAPAPSSRPVSPQQAHAGPAPGPPAQAPAAGWAGSRGRGNLRARLTTFVGREEDIRAIGGDLARARLVTLLGPGGAGKTRLSQEAAEAHAPAADWPDGVWLAELAPVDDPDDVAEAVLTALGARETKLRGASAEEMRALTDRVGDDPLDRLVEHCARLRLLLVLDNCEHVVGAAAELAEQLLVHCPGVRILATSR